MKWQSWNQQLIILKIKINENIFIIQKNKK